MALKGIVKVCTGELNRSHAGTYRMFAEAQLSSFVSRTFSAAEHDSRVNKGAMFIHIVGGYRADQATAKG